METNKVRLACQTITFGGEQKQHFPQVFEAVAKAGYTGVEIGFRHIAHLDPADLSKQLSEVSLQLVAAHLGGNLEDPAQAEGERQMLEVVSDFLNASGCNLLMYSGLHWKDPCQFATDVSMLSRSAERCKARNIDLLYHNHNWEFQDNGKVINGLMKTASAALGLCPDLGWVHRGGGDVLSFLKDNAERLGAIHFKDFSAVGPGADTVVLGTGVAPLREAAAWLRANKPQLWMIAEQDRCKGEPYDAIAANAAFLKQVFHG